MLVLSPSYPEAYYPEYWSYNLAGMTREVTIDFGLVVDPKPEEWTLDDVRRELEARVGGMDLVGHSAVGQLVYQLVLLARAGMLDDVRLRGTSVKPSTEPREWIFGDFDRIFERVRDELHLEAHGYDMFGHSAGGQILHRLAIFHPHGHADRILAANSGWYTVPALDIEFPYGVEPDVGHDYRRTSEAAAEYLYGDGGP